MMLEMVMGLTGFSPRYHTASAGDIRVPILDALPTSTDRQSSEEQGAGALPLVLVSDGDGGLGDRPFEGVPDVARDADTRDLGSGEVERHDRLVLDVIDTGQVLDLAVGEVVHVSVEAEVARPRGQPAQSLDQPVTVVRPDLTQEDPGPVPELGLTTPLLGGQPERVRTGCSPVRVVVYRRLLRGR
jgi:hypothetical protein